MNNKSCHITVAICTWNRAALLDKTLESLRKMEIPRGISWELVVVNNKCTDNTDEIIEKHRAALPLVKVFESRQGHSNARNAAVAHASGKYIIWTDDDVLVDPGWFSAYVSAFERWQDAAVFGGKVLPLFEVPALRWLEDNLDWLSNCYALRDFGNEECLLPSGENPYGANLAFKTESLRRHQFNPNLGRKGEVLTGGEETEVISKLRKEGESVVWVPTSSVQHIIPESRMNIGYIRRYNHGQGYCRANFPEKNVITYFGVPRWMLRRWLTLEFKWIFQRLSGRSSKVWLKPMSEAAFYLGQMAAIRANEQ